MELIDIRIAKRKLEDDINKILVEFTEKNGIVVKNINCHYWMDVSSDSRVTSKYRVSIKLEDI